MPRAELGRVHNQKNFTGLVPLLDPVDASHDRTGKHLYDRAASRSNGDLPSKVAERSYRPCPNSSKSNRVSTALGRAPTYEGDERTDQEHNSGSDRETCNPRPDLLCLLLDLFPFLRRHVHRSHVFQLFLRPHVFLAFRAASSPFSKYTNPIVDLKSSLSKTADDATILRSQSPIRSKSSHCRRLPLKPRLSATWKLEMRQRSICFRSFPARSQTDPVWTTSRSLRCIWCQKVPSFWRFW